MRRRERAATGGPPSSGGGRRCRTRGRAGSGRHRTAMAPDAGGCGFRAGRDPRSTPVPRSPSRSRRARPRGRAAAVHRLPAPRPEFRIADTFTDSLARLTGDEQKAVKTTAFDLQMNPANPGMSFHKLDKAQGQELLVGARQQRHPADRPQDARRACCSATSITTTRPTRGPSGASWRRIRRPARRSWWRFASASRRSPFPSTSRWQQPAPRQAAAVCAAFRRGVAGLRCAGRMAGRRAAGRRRQLCWTWPTICRARRPRRCWSWRPAVSRSVRSASAPRRDSIRSSIPTRSAASAS